MPFPSASTGRRGLLPSSHFPVYSHFIHITDVILQRIFGFGSE